jgi:hypothetical protein
MVLSELREPTLELLCERCGDRGRFGVTELLAKHGDAKLADLAVELARCPRVRGVRGASFYDRCKVRWAMTQNLKETSDAE